MISRLFFPLPGCRIIFLILTFGITEASRSSPWEVIRVAEKNFVSTDNISTFYDFDRHEKEPENSNETLLSPSMKVSFQYQKGENFILINDVRHFLHEPLVWQEETSRLLLGTKDLVHIIDPVFRPSQDGVFSENPRLLLKIECENKKIAEVIDNSLRRAVGPMGLMLVEDPTLADVSVRLHLKQDSNRANHTIFTQWTETEEGKPYLAIKTSTALHSGLVHDLGISDVGIHPAGIQKEQLPEGSSPQVEIQLSEDLNNINAKKVSESIVDGLARLLEFPSFPQDFSTP